MKIKKNGKTTQNESKKIHKINKKLRVSKTKLKFGKTRRSRRWTGAQMKQAIQMVKSNTLNMSTASQRFNIPLSTLAMYLKENRPVNEEETDESVEEVDEELSEIVSENGIESGSVSSVNSRDSKTLKPKVILMARKSTSPLKIFLNSKFKNVQKPCDDILRNFEEQKKVKKEENYPKEVIDTNFFIDSIISNGFKSKFGFLKEFEKPIKLYNYIGMRQKYHPIFLNRNLSYVNESIDKIQNETNPKKKLKVDEILDFKKQKLQKQNDNELQLKLDSVQITKKEDVLHIKDKMKTKQSDSVSIEIFLSKSCDNTEPMILSNIPNKNIKIVDQNSLLLVTLTNSQFITIKVDNLMSQGFKFLSINIKIYDKVFMLRHELKNLLRFFAKCPKATPSKSHLYDFTFKLNDEHSGVVKHKSVQNLIDSYNSSNSIRAKVKITRCQPQMNKEPKPSLNQKLNQIMYQFSDQNDKKLVTKTNSLKCPFCSLDSIKDQDMLFKHLVHCHFRFQVKQTINQNGVNSLKFELNIEDTFDGSYCGNLHDLIKTCHLGYSKSRLVPTRQISVDSTEILVNKRSFKLNLKELIKNENLSKHEIETLTQIQHQLLKISCSIDQGAQQKNNFMQRVYYHTVTSQPVHIDELDYDSDSQMDPEWLKELTDVLINDFADVNEGEKEFMKLWNLHCLHYNFVADSQIYTACSMFIDEKIDVLYKESLINNFILHLVNLNDYGLLNRVGLVKLIEYLNDKLRSF